MKTKLVCFVLICALSAFAQHGHGGAAGGPPAGAGMGRGAEMGRGDVGHGNAGDAGRASKPGHDNHDTDHGAQKPLNDHQVNGGAFRMLEQRTGMTSDQLKAMYGSSGAKNFGQFASAIVVSKNLNLDTNKVLAGLKTQSLGQTLQSLGVAHDKAKDEIERAEHEVKDAEKKSG